MKPMLRLVGPEGPKYDEIEHFATNEELLKRIEARLRIVEIRVGTLATHCPIARRIELEEQ